MLGLLLCITTVYISFRYGPLIVYFMADWSLSMTRSECNILWNNISDYLTGKTDKRW